MPGLTDLVRRRQTPCAEVALALPAYVAGETTLDPRTSQHVAQCLRCQVEVVRYRRMLRALHDLRDGVPGPPPAALSDVLGQLGTGVRLSRTILGIVAAAAFAAGAAGGAGTLVWAARRGHLVHLLPALATRAQEMEIRLPTSRASTKAMTRA